MTLVFGHRGSSAYAPPNTLPAFELAAKQSVPGVELDVHLSADGHLVVIHDFSVDTTTNGQGEVVSMTLAQLKTLDAGSSFNPKFAGTQIPTLDEVFAILQGKLTVNVEIKADTEGIEQAVNACLDKYQMRDKVIISSFNPAILQRFRAAAPGVPIGFLYAPLEGFDLTEILSTLPCEALHPYHEGINARFMSWAREQGYRVNTWTVNDPARAMELRDLGVDVIISDQPDVLQAAIT